MADVTEHVAVTKSATASACVVLTEDAAAAVRDDAVPAGDMADIARVAGIMAAKRTPELIPFANPLPLSGIELDVCLVAQTVQIRATVRTEHRSGVAMEALTAVSVAGLTVVDMVKGIDPAAVLTDVELVSVDGAADGAWRRGPADEQRHREGATRVRDIDTSEQAL